MLSTVGPHPGHKFLERVHFIFEMSSERRNSLTYRYIGYAVDQNNGHVGGKSCKQPSSGSDAMAKSLYPVAGTIDPAGHLKQKGSFSVKGSSPRLAVTAGQPRQTPFKEQPAQAELPLR